MLDNTSLLDAANIELGAPLTLLPPTHDYIFKELFRDERHKKMTISFLNAILNGRPVVTDFTVLNPDLPPLIPGNVGVRLDLRVKTDQNRYIDIEMQCYDDPNLIDRSLHYLAAAEAEYFKREDVAKGGIIDYSEPRIIGIWILARNHKKFSGTYPSPIHDVTFHVNANEYGDPNGEISDKFRAIFLEMPKFKALKPSQLRLLRYWMAFLSDPTNPANHRADSHIAEAYEALRVLSLDRRVREIYDSLEDGRRDQLSLLNGKLKEERAKAEAALKEERAKAEAEKKTALEESKLQIARGLLRCKVLSLEQIAESTGLSLEKVKELACE